MAGATLLTSFDDYRDRMIEITDAARTRLTQAPPNDTDLLDLARARMARILTAYHLFAQRELFGPCLVLAGPDDRERVRAIERECAALAHDFRAFARQCSVQPVRERWTSYRSEALAMMERVRRHLNKAEAEARWCQTMRKQPVRPAASLSHAA